MENYVNDNYIEKFCEEIFELKEENEIRKFLPDSEYETSLFLVKKTIEFLEMKITELEQEETLIHEDYEMRILFLKDIRLQAKKLRTCKEIQKEIENILELEKKAEETPEKHLIFATTPIGKVYLEEDIHTIPKEFYDRILDCLETIENNTQGNIRKEKSLGKNNKKLVDIREAIEFQIRVCYRYLTPDTAFVILAKTKKSDNNLQDREDIIVRGDKTEEEFEILKEKMKDNQTKEQIINRNKEIKERIIKQLSPNQKRA